MNNTLNWEVSITTDINAGDIRIFNEIINKFSPVVLNYVHRLIKNSETAEELTQEVFLKFWKIRKKYKPKTKLVTYLYRIAYTITIDFIRKNKKFYKTYQLDEINAKHIEKSYDDENQDNTELIDKINNEIERLPIKQRQAIILKTYEEKNYEEIAQVMYVSIASVESLLFRARQTLKKKLKLN